MNQEILRLVDTIHRDKDIDKEVVFQALEAAYLSAVKKKLGESEETRVVIDRQTGDYKVYEGQKEVYVSDLGRIAASAGKQVLLQKIREAERDVVYDEYIGKAGKLVSGVVQRFEGPNIIVNMGKVEGILPRSEQAPGERFRTGERIKVLIKDIKKNTNRVRITLSRTSPEMVRALFALEVPEVAEKVIDIVEIAREPGYRTKVAVTTYDHNVDCVGACVGVRGSRIKNIVDELFGEKIDIVRWNESIEVLIMNALKPAEISSMDLDFETKKAKVYVKPEQQSLAIGKRGQNVRLASRLCGWDLDIVTISEEDLEKLRTDEVFTPASPAAAAAAAALGAEGVAGAPPPAGETVSVEPSGGTPEGDGGCADAESADAESADAESADAESADAAGEPPAEGGEETEEPVPGSGAAISRSEAGEGDGIASEEPLAVLAPEKAVNTDEKTVGSP
jgi:N utilization substance protein A